MRVHHRIRVALALLAGIAVMNPFSTSSAEEAAPQRTERRLLTDFTATTPDLGWFVVNDNVMGGRSEGDFTVKDGELLFRGRTNTDGGGFSSIRTRPVSLKLVDYEGLALRVKGDGRTYKVLLRTNARWRGMPISYQAEFETQADVSTEARMAFEDFTPRFRGRQLAGPTLDPSKIEGLGLMIYDKRDGSFTLRVDTLAAYRDVERLALSTYRWSRRLLVVAAPKASDERVRKQLAGIDANRKAFAARDMTLLLLYEEDASTAAGKRVAKDDAERVRRELGIAAGEFAVRLVGKDGGVKRSADRPVPMREIYEQIDQMPMRRQEMRERGR